MNGFEILLILLVVLIIATLLKKSIRERARAKPIGEGKFKGASGRVIVFRLVLLNFLIVLLVGFDALIRFGELSRYMQVQLWLVAPVFYSMLMAACLVAIAYRVMKDEEHVNEIRLQLKKTARNE